MSTWICWVIAGIFLVIAEMTTFTFYLLWLGVGAFAAAFCTRFTDDVIVQIIVGCIVAFILTILTRPLTRNVRHSSVGFYDPYQDIVGKTGIVQEAISPNKMGHVRVGSDVWSANSSELINAGEIVVVTERSSTILTVQKAEVSQTKEIV
jgi:membrane protein implicated in regulation of membrane protease activity